MKVRVWVVDPEVVEAVLRRLPTSKV